MWDEPGRNRLHPAKFVILSAPIPLHNLSSYDQDGSFRLPVPERESIRGGGLTRRVWSGWIHLIRPSLALAYCKFSAGEGEGSLS